MIRTNTTQVTLDLSDGNYHLGEIEARETGGVGHGGVLRSSERIKVPIHFHVLGSDDQRPLENYEDPAVVIYSTPGALQKFCKDALKQLGGTVA